jgi:hypothetical protein
VGSGPFDFGFRILDFGLKSIKNMVQGSEVQDTKVLGSGFWVQRFRKKRIPACHA